MIKKRQKTVTVTVFEIFPFLGQNGWGTVRERLRNDQNKIGHNETLQKIGTATFGNVSS